MAWEKGDWHVRRIIYPADEGDQGPSYDLISLNRNTNQLQVKAFDTLGVLDATAFDKSWRMSLQTRDEPAGTLLRRIIPENILLLNQPANRTQTVFPIVRRRRHAPDRVGKETSDALG